MQIVRGLDEEFTRLGARSLALVRALPPERLYWQPPRGRERFFPAYSCGEHLLRSAAAVEQTFGGITANLWDDPFEWTLPETLPTPERVAEYLAEVEATRRRGFALFKADADLLKELAVPPGGMRTLFALLVETLARAAHHQGRAFATFRLFSDERLPRV
ncbi:MAG TPA: DinB family protein [Pyrinomonadaceae bacterium]|nr:DinB family protein [Pyrinomonadaceae bacterium]